MELEKIDKNMATQTVIEKDGLRFISPEDPSVSLYGVFKTEKGYARMTPSVAEQVSPGVGYLNYNTSGGKLRFVTDSKKVAIIAKRNTGYNPDHMTYVLVAGFDVYADDVYVTTFRPGVKASGDQSFEAACSFDEKRERVITINFPAYGPVSEILVGFEIGSTVKPSPEHKYEKPVVFYGSSITQGGCASRPGLVYTSVISRMLDANVLNLGFSGGAKGEPIMAEYIAGLEMSAFVLDYDANAGTPEYLAETHEPFFKIIREKQPDLPIVMMPRPLYLPSPERDARIAAIRKTYENAKAAGDRHVYYLETSETLAPIGNDGTVDGCHPNDLGFWHMAKGLYPVLKEALESSGK